jgi:hypothetical protein
MTPDLLRHLADVLTALSDAKPYGKSYILTEPVAARIVDAGSKIAALLSVSDARFADAAEALRAHATTLTKVNTLDAAVDEVDRATNAALLATITAAHDNDLPAASEAASLAFGLLGLDSGFRVRVEKATTLTPVLPEGWAMNDCGTGTPEYTRYAAHGPCLSSVVLYHYRDGRVSVIGDAAPPAVYAYLLARAGVMS